MEQMSTVEFQKQIQNEKNGSSQAASYDLNIMAQGNQNFDLYMQNQHFMQQEQQNFLMRQQHFQHQQLMMLEHQQQEGQKIQQKIVQEQNLEQEKQEQVQVEDNEQQELEDEREIITMKYHGAEQFLKEETKQIVTNKEIEKTKMSILTIEKNDLLQEISEQEKVVEQLKTEDDLLKINTGLMKNEMKEFQQSIQSHKNIVDKIKSIVESQTQHFHSVKDRAIKAFADVCKQEKEHKEWELAANEELVSLKAQVQAQRAAVEDTDRKNKELDMEKMQLQLKIAEQREYLESLNKKEQELDISVPDGDFAVEIKRLKELLMKKKQMLQQLHCKNEDIKRNNENEIALLNQRKEEIDKRGEQLEAKRLEVIKKNDEVLSKIEITNQKMAEQQLNIKDLQEKISKKNKLYDELQVRLDEQNKDFDKQKAEAQATIEKVRSEIAEANTVYEKRRQHLDQLNRSISLKMEEYSQLLDEKHRRDLDELKEETMKEKVDDLDKKIAKSQEKNKILEEKLKQLEEDTTVQVLQKEKAYLESSLVYINEKLDNTKTTIEEEKGLVGKLEDENKAMDKGIEDLKKRNEELEKKIRSFKENAQAAENQQPMVGILKPSAPPAAATSTTVSTTTKQYPMSPKKVQFDHSQSRIHEFSIPSSSSISGDPGTQTNEMKTFDQLMEEFKSKETAKVPMKTKIDFGL